MSCERCIELMVDVLYGEEVAPRLCFEFFQHLNDCGPCRKEYTELLETRESLAQWKPEHSDPISVRLPQTGKLKLKMSHHLQWWALLQKVAAAVLIVAGAFSLLRSAGLWPVEHRMVSDAQLTELLHDVTLARQVEDWKVIGAALLELQERMEAQNRLQIQAVYEDLHVLEQRYVQALEESNRQVRTLIGN